MFKRGSPFQIPQIPGVRKIIKEQNSARKNQQSIQIQCKPTQNNCKLTTNPLQLSPSTVDQRFCFQLDVPAEGDQTLFWQYSLSPKVTGQYARRLIFRQLQFISRSLSQAQVAQTIYICADDVPGYCDILGIPTSRVCALHLTQSQTVIDDTGSKAYDLIYKQTQDCAWDIPLNLSTVKFRIQFDDTLRTGQLNVPLICQFDIRHVGK